jgi:Uma2 family endonuclease
MNVAAIAPVRKLTRREYDQLVGMGWFRDERIELIDGVLVAVSPQGPMHAETVTRLNMLLVPRLLGRAVVRVQLPLAVGPVSEPEPDLAVVAPATHARAHPEPPTW